MKRLLILSTSVLLLTGPGCAGHRQSATTGSVRRTHLRTSANRTTTAAVTGVVTRSACGSTGLANLEQIGIAGNPLTRGMPAGDVLETAQPVTMRLTASNGALYDAVFAAHPDSPQTTVRAKIVNPLFIYGGYALAWGRWPVVQTEWIQAGAEGSTIAVEVAGQIQRVYYLRESEAHHKVTVTCQATATPIAELATPCTFVEILPHCAVIGPTPIRDSQSASDFIHQVKPIALTAGWNEDIAQDCTN